jgi:hypothetical protein
MPSCPAGNMLLAALIIENIELILGQYDNIDIQKEKKFTAIRRVCCSKYG